MQAGGSARPPNVLGAVAGNGRPITEIPQLCGRSAQPVPVIAEESLFGPHRAPVRITPHMPLPAADAPECLAPRR
ncbi:hypothetical protein [Streptomyces sp. NPDC000880]